MEQYTVEQRVFIVKTYFENHSFAEVQRLFRLHFPDRNPPDKKNIWRNVKKYVDHGTSLNRNQNNSRNPQLVKRAVRDMIRRSQDCIENGGKHITGTHG